MPTDWLEGDLTPGRPGDPGGLQAPPCRALPRRLLGTDQTTPVADSLVNDVACPVPNSCGNLCPQVQRVLPFTGTFYVAVRASGGNGCIGGKYRRLVTMLGGATPVLVHDDL